VSDRAETAPSRSIPFSIHLRGDPRFEALLQKDNRTEEAITTSRVSTCHAVASAKSLVQKVVGEKK